MIDLLILLYNFIPAILIHLIVIAGIFFCAASYVVPYFLPFAFQMRYVGVIAIAIGLYLEGGFSIVKEYQSRQAVWAEKVKVVEEKSNQVNTKIEYVYKDRVKVVKDVQIEVREKIKEVAVSVDQECKITKDTVDILNYGAANGKR